MKKIVLAICLISSLTIKLAAQTPSPSGVKTEKQDRKQLSPEERAKKDAERAEKKLALTNEQKTKWELAALERAKANSPLKEKMKGCTTPDERKAIHKQMRLNKNNFNTTVSAMLTLDQKTKFEQEKKNHHSKHKHRSHAKKVENIPEEQNNTK